MRRLLTAALVCLSILGARPTFAREFDAETGLVHMGARDYDPGTGRFLQEDPVFGEVSQPQTLHPYAYVGNNPIIRTDPLGLTWRESPGLVWDWLFESGEGSRYYGQDAASTRELMMSRGISKIRQEFINNRCAQLQSGRKGGQAYLDSTLHPFNGTAVQLGGYSANVRLAPNGMAIFTVDNSLSLWSAVYHLPGLPKYLARGGGVPLMGNLNQRFQWQEANICGCQ